MTKSIECSQNWKKLKMELKSETDKARPQKRKHENNLTDSSPKKKRKNKTKAKNNSAAPEPTAQEVKQSYSSKPSHNPSKSKKDSASEIWFDDVDARDIMATEGDDVSLKRNLEDNSNKLVKPHASKEVTKIIGMDCALVGVGEMNESALARVSIVNRYGVCVYDKYVKPKESVSDYRTNVSGIEEKNLENAEKFETVQKEVADIILGRIVVGHGLSYGLKALYLTHPRRDLRDTARDKLFKSFSSTRKPALRLLCLKFLDVEIQKGRRSTLENAQAAMKLFIMHKRNWGHIHSKKRYNKIKSGSKKRKRSRPTAKS